MKILTVIGARPQFIKVAAVSRRLRGGDFPMLSEVLVHTGQHYDPNMSQVFFDELDIPPPDINLKVGSGTQAAQTGAIMTALEPVLTQMAPDFVLVFGDTNSTLAAAVASAKAGIPIAHVEAGLRSFRRGMAEEVNRVVTDRLSDLLFCPTREAIANLAAEGRTDAHMVGDVMLDAFHHARSKIDTAILSSYGLDAGGYALATVHRAESTDDAERLRQLFDGLSGFSRTLPVILPLHPRTRNAMRKQGIEAAASVKIIDPVSYLTMVALLTSAGVVATDSGGLQKEASMAGVPCVTLRDETEWVETVASGWNRLPELTASGIEAALHAALEKPDCPPPGYGDGDAAGKILGHIAGWRS